MYGTVCAEVDLDLLVDWDQHVNVYATPRQQAPSASDWCEQAETDKLAAPRPIVESMVSDSGLLDGVVGLMVPAALSQWSSRPHKSL